MDVLNVSFGYNNEETSGDEFAETEEDDGPQDTKQNPTQNFGDWGRTKSSMDSEPTIFTKFYLLDCNSWASPDSTNSSSRKHVMRLFGLTEEGQTVCCFVHGFFPYMYLTASNTLDENDARELQGVLNYTLIKQMKKIGSMTRYSKYFSEEKPPIVEVKIVDYENQICNYHSPKGNTSKTVLKVSCALTKFLSMVNLVIEDGLVTFPFVDEFPTYYNCYEHHINPTQRFLASLDISCCTWIEFSAPVLSSCTSVAGKRSYAAIEIDVTVDQIKPASSIRYDVAPELVPSPPKSIRVLSFDIECMVPPPPSSSSKIPPPVIGAEQILQIGNVVFSPGDSDDASQRKIMFALKDLEPLPETEIVSFSTEKELLQAWRDFVVAVDPDIILGYNIHKFDLPYLLERARKLEINNFAYFSRIIRAPATKRSISNESKRLSRFTDVIWSVPGRIVFDMLPVLRSKFPGESNHKLETMARRFLTGEYKDDVKYSEIHQLQNESPRTRAKLAKYCLQDAWLTLQLMLQNPCRDDNHTFLSYFCYESQAIGSPLRHLVTKSKCYSEHFKRIRKHKNPAVKFPSLPSIGRKQMVPAKIRELDTVKRVLFE